MSPTACEDVLLVVVFCESSWIVSRMRANTFFALSALAVASIATPIDNAAKAAQDTSARIGADDSNILGFALTLEHLETAFYSAAALKFKASDFQNPALYGDLLRLVRDEGTHVTKISEALKSSKRPVPGPCNYTFPFNTTPEFLKLASVIEGVGVSAYAGAATSIKSRDVLRMAAAILPVEARHDAILRLAVDVPPYAAPFDVPLTFRQAWTLASQFIVKDSCPKAVANLGISAFPPLTLVQDASVTTVTANTIITMKVDIAALNTTQSRDIKHKRHDSLHHKREAQAAPKVTYAAFLTVAGSTNVEAKVEKGVITVKVPAGLFGQTYVVLTTSKTGVTDKLTLAGPAIIEISDSVQTGSAGDAIPVKRINANGSASISAGISVGSS